MPCSCTSGSRWTVTRPNGTTEVYRSLTEATAAATRSNGTVRKTK